MHHLLSRAPRLVFALFSRRFWHRPSQHVARSSTQPAPAPMPSRLGGRAQGASPWDASTAARGARTQPPGQPRARPATAPRPVPAPASAPLVRVLRRHEGTAGRLAIVGRMADVCAELDRLAARERLC